MLEKDHKSELCSAIRTSRYARKVVTLLRDISENLYKTDSSNPLEEMEDSMEGELLDFFKNYLSGVDLQNPLETEEALRKVIDYLTQVEELNFIVPIHPNEDFVKRLHGWCSENVDDEVLLDFTTNRLMESGLIMIYKGHYFSYTLEDLLDEYFSEHDLNKYYVSTQQEEVQNGQ
jgi:hypothetical protein